MEEHIQELNQKVVGESGIEHLTNKEDIGAQSWLQHNGHVGGIEESDGVWTARTTLARGLHWDLNTETLEVDNSGEDDDGGQQVHDVWEILAVESLLKSTLLVWPCEEKVEKSNHGTLEFRSSAGVDRSWGEGLPDNRLADVGSNEKRNTTAQAISLLEKLIK